MDSLKINKVQIRNLMIEDYDQLAQSFTRVYSDGSDVFWTHKQIEKLIKIFPEGQIVTVVDEKIVGCALSIIVNYDDVKNDHTYAQVTGKETFNTHNPKGKGMRTEVLPSKELFGALAKAASTSSKAVSPTEVGWGLSTSVGRWPM